MFRRDPRVYAAVAVRWAGRSDLSLLSDARNRVVVFDNARVAADCIPIVVRGVMRCRTCGGSGIRDQGLGIRTGVPMDCIPCQGTGEEGRLTSWDAAEERCWFTPLDPDGINEAAVITDYDVYNLPPGLPTPSETRLLGWRHHVIWSQWYDEIRRAAA